MKGPTLLLAIAAVGGLGFLALRRYGAALKLSTSSEDKIQEIAGAYRAAGGTKGTEEQAGVSIATNEAGSAAASATLKSARNYLKTSWPAGGNGAARSLQVVRPKDKRANWRLGESCWFQAQGEAAGWRTSPIEAVRGLDLGVAFSFWPDVYGPSSYRDSGTNTIVNQIAVAFVGPPKKKVWLGLLGGGAATQNNNCIPIPDVDGGARLLDVFVSASNESGGQVIVWDPVERRQRFKGDYTWGMTTTEGSILSQRLKSGDSYVQTTWGALVGKQDFPLFARGTR